MYEEESDSKPEIEESQYFPEEDLFKEEKEEQKTACFKNKKLNI